MGLAEKLELLVSLDPSKAISGLETLSGKAEESTKKVESSFSKVSSAALKVGTAGIAAGAFLTELGSKEQAASQQLEAAMSTAGDSVEEYSGRIEDAVSRGEDFGDSAVQTKNALTTLVGAYGDTGTALDQMTLVEDLAKNRHIELSAAADMVAKAHGGSARLFKQFGIQVKENADGTKDYDGALTELAGKLSGQAAAATDTWAGKLDALRTKVEDQVAAFGEKYGPAIMAVSGAMTAAGGIASGFSAIMNKVRDAHAAAAAAAEADAVAEEGAAAAHSGVLATLGPLAVGIGLVAAAYEGWQHSETLTVDVQKAARASTDDLVRGYTALGQSFAGTSGQLDMFKTLAEGNIGTAQRLRDALKAQGVDVTQLEVILGDVSTAQKQANEDTKAAAGDTADVTEKVQNYDTALKTLHDTLHAQMDPLFAMEHALADNAAAQAAANAAAADGSTTAADLAAANQHVAETALSVTDATNNLVTGFHNGTVSMSAAKDQLALWVQQGLLTQGQADAVAASLGTIADKANELDGKSIKMRVELETQAAQRELEGLGQGTHYKGIGFAEGGMVDQVPKGQPMLAVVHGGEYVLTADEVDAAKRGGGMSRPFATSGVTNVYNIYGSKQDAEAIAEAVRRVMLRTGKRNGRNSTDID